MQALTAALLFLGLTLAPAGTLAYVYTALTGTDPETLRIAKAAAVTGRWFAIAGSVEYLGDAIHDGAGTPPLMVAVLMLAAAAIVASHLTRLRPPHAPRYE